MINILLLFNTIRYLKFKQIVYQIKNKIKILKLRILPRKYDIAISSKSYPLELKQSIITGSSFKSNSFFFLNESYHFENEIDWNYFDHGKLWNYNLNYFDFLCQKKITSEEGLILIGGFIDKLSFINDGLEPYPISLRSINWIKFLILNDIKQTKIDNSLFVQYDILQNNIEYHLLGNHLLENGFSLLFGAYYFQDDKLYTKASKILKKELVEQVLNDGGHFELSPMYHQLILFRVLDCINLVQNNSFKNFELLPFLESRAKIMLNWINRMTFKSGDIPQFNDSTKNISPTTDQLNNYACQLGISFGMNNYSLSDSGYRKFENEYYEIVLDIGDIGPDYIPGHAHADTFNFELYINENPFLVDTGISTYEKNKKRQNQRSTNSHNTVVINNQNQSQVWGGFRVGRRARIIKLLEKDNQVVAAHDGYKSIGIIHEREFRMTRNNIVLFDQIIGEEFFGTAYFHLHPTVINPRIEENQVSFQNLKQMLLFEGKIKEIRIDEFEFCEGFNKVVKSKLVKVIFFKKLKTIISIK